MRINLSVLAGILLVFLAIGAVTVIPAQSQTVGATTTERASDIGAEPSSPTSTIAVTTTTLQPTTTAVLAPTSTSSSSSSTIAETTPTSTTSSSTSTTSSSTTSTTAAPSTTTSIQPTTTAVPATTSTAPPSSQALAITAPPAAANGGDQVLSAGRFEALVEDEIYRLTNCARTADFNNWCIAGDAANWNVSSGERTYDGSPLSALSRDVALDTDSQRWSEYLIDYPRIFHSNDAGTVYGENVAYNPKLHAEYQLTPTNAADLAAMLMQQWMDSPSHRVQILYPGYQAFGVGVAVEVSPPSPDIFVEIWGTQQFQ